MSKWLRVEILFSLSSYTQPNLVMEVVEEFAKELIEQ
jgi:hypothetical protein